MVMRKRSVVNVVVYCKLTLIGSRKADIIVIVQEMRGELFSFNAIAT